MTLDTPNNQGQLYLRWAVMAALVVLVLSIFISVGQSMRYQEMLDAHRNPYNNQVIQHVEQEIL